MLGLVIGAALAGAAPAPATALPPPERRQELLFEAAKLGRTDLIPLLVQNGADVNAYEARGFTPLILAAYNGQAAAVEALIAAGADPCKPDANQGNTAQMGVAFKGDDAIAARLLKASCDVNVRNKAGQTALMMAALFGRTRQIDMLVKAGADPAIADASGRTASSVAASQGNTELASRLSAAPR
ncbi:ankyrin repeat domain-containing protein [Sphingomonas sp. AP4-R1]|uniref:ankyrin repeat domain-containing protein n=1 Tax=Sphingomonas sp. AP4-R1 TaxID=2735134 RepID=UPI001493CE5C|nr:ankyrin repeat domain-containing protein [Sphingomonas sp. AP4-R1]QJU60696.1 ankyrin repeat domain-containing protein [Sphingomonas sp. AP4-R1]